MPINVQCPGCGSKCRASDEAAGKRARCPKCGQVIIIQATVTPSSPRRTVVSPQEPATTDRPKLRSSLPLPQKQAHWMWYLAGGIAAVSLVIVIAMIFPLLGSDKNGPPAVGKSLASLPSGGASLAKPEMDQESLSTSRAAAQAVDPKNRNSTERVVTMREQPGKQANTSVSSEPEGIRPRKMVRPVRKYDLPPLPSNLGWKETDKKDLDQAMAAAVADPVSACLTFKQILDREKDPPNSLQKQWLERAMSVTRPVATEILQYDMSEALAASDLRSAMIAMVVAGKLEKGLLRERAGDLASLKSTLFSGKTMGCCVWKITNVRGEFLNVPYSEGFSVNQITIQPKASFSLLRLTATVKNVSRQNDLPYAGWTLGDFKRGLLFLELPTSPEKKQKHGGPRRIAVDDFFYLLTPGGDMLSCQHVCEGCGTLRGVSFTIQKGNGEGGMFFTGSYVNFDEQFDVDLLFSVPQGINDLRLWVLGAPPVTIPTVRKQE